MPAHDWTRVQAGTFHAFHLAWMAELQKALNSGLLPPDYYALAEQMARSAAPDVLTLQTRDAPQGSSNHSGNGGIGIQLAPPRVRFTAKLDGGPYARKARQLTIRHESDDRIVAVLEILSPGNKRTRVALRQFVDKACAVLEHGYHLLVIDLLPPGPGDPQGIHGAVWSELGGEPYVPPPDKPLSLGAYNADEPITAYVEPFAVGDLLTEMPLFLEPDWYINVPLEATYRAAWEGLPARVRQVLDKVDGPSS
jgi:hypothetical protein